MGIMVAMAIIFLSPAKVYCGPGLPILIDTGIGECFSDLYTISQAARTPGLDLVGVTTSFYNTEESARTVQKLLDLLDRPDIPVSYGVVSKGTTNLWLQWSQGFTPVIGAKSPACDLLIEISKQHDGELFVIATGPLTNLAAALQKDPGIANRIRRIYLPDVDCSGLASPSLSADPESARTVFSTTIPITVFPSILCRDLVLTSNRILGVAHCWSPLTDELVHLSCQYRKLLAGEEPLITIPGCLAVAYANAPAYTQTETKQLQLLDGVLREAEGMTGREVQVATSTHPAALLREVVSRLSDTNLDFGTTFAHFVIGLNKLGKEALQKVQQGLQGGIPVPEVSQDKSASDVFRIQAMAYIGGYIGLLKGLDDPVAREMLDRFKETILRIGEIGWWFPDWFYEKWCYEGSPGKPMVFHFGISNGAAQELTGIHGSITLEGHTESATISSTTKEVRFELVVDASQLPKVWPSKVELKTTFNCQGEQYVLTDNFPLIQASPCRIMAVRCATGTLDIGTISGITSTLTVDSLNSPQQLSLQQPLPPQPELTWTHLPVEKRDLAQTEAVRLAFNNPEGRQLETVSKVVLLPPAGEILLVEPVGPSKSSCFAVSKSGRWGWSTNRLDGADSLEFRVSHDVRVTSSTDALFVEIEYFCEGDDLDTFRIEGATESAVYQPLTAWMTKPEERGWRTDRFRVSPMVETMIRTHTLHWLRVCSGQDGEEVIRSIRF
jgi:purine nucleosidase